VFVFIQQKRPALLLKFQCDLFGVTLVGEFTITRAHVGYVLFHQRDDKSPFKGAWSVSRDPF